MRYFCVSDIHGDYDKLIQALNDAHFNAAEDTLINVGDPFDRGHQNKEVLDFLLSLPHRILIWGNHDRRLFDILSGGSVYGFLSQADLVNGTGKTILELAHDLVPDKDKGSYSVCIMRLRNYAPIWQYFRECHFAVEFPDLIITHAWLPYVYDEENIPVLCPDWRKVGIEYWDECVWANTGNLVENNQFPDKKLLVGHWFAWLMAEQCGEIRTLASYKKKSAPIDCSIFEIPNKAIFIDGCARYPTGGQVIVYTFESDAAPTFYK